MNSKDFVSEIVEHLTGKTPEVHVQEDEHGAILTVTPHGNVASLIGRQGSTIDAIRILCKAIGYNGKYRIKLILDENGKTRL